MHMCKNYDFCGKAGGLRLDIQHELRHAQFIAKDNSKNMRVKLNDRQLIFVVRDRFENKKTQKLIVESHMPNNGVIFSDGIQMIF